MTGVITSLLCQAVNYLSRDFRLAKTTVKMQKKQVLHRVGIWQVVEWGN